MFIPIESAYSLVVSADPALRVFVECKPFVKGLRCVFGLGDSVR